MKNHNRYTKLFFNYSIFLLLFFNACKAQSVTTINVNDQGVFAMKKSTETDEEKYARWSKIRELFQYAINNKVDLYFPAGLYDVGNRNFPFRTPDEMETDKLLDCGNIKIFGEKGTILKTSSVYGADVLQLNKVKNITFRNFEITASLAKYERSGSNGISITNGFDNIVLENILIYDLPGVDKKTWVDGSKGLTIQSDAGSKGYMGTLVAKNITVKNSAYGFRMDTRNVSDILDHYKTINIDLDMSVDKAFQGFSIEFGKAVKNVLPEAKLNIKATVKLINCQQYIRFARVIGGEYNFHVDRTQTYDQVLRDNNQKVWSIEHDGVFGFLSYYTKNAKLSVVGNIGEVDTKIWIGAVGSIVEPFNLKNRTENNIFNFDIAGTAKQENVRIIKWEGNSLYNNDITISKKTTQDIPLELSSNKNHFKR